MSDSPPKPDLSSSPTPSEPAVPERRRKGRALLVAASAGAALSMVACEPAMTTNPVACTYDGGFYDDCGNEYPDASSDAGPDAGADGGTLVKP